MLLTQPKVHKNVPGNLEVKQTEDLIQRSSNFRIFNNWLDYCDLYSNFQNDFVLPRHKCTQGDGEGGTSFAFERFGHENAG